MAMAQTMATPIEISARRESNIARFPNLWRPYGSRMVAILAARNWEYLSHGALASEMQLT
jgi:hypothetical protein